jgi:hypothetical protein
MTRGIIIAAALVTSAVFGVLGWSHQSAPERRVDAYLAATRAGDEAAALEAWPLFSGGAHPRAELVERRVELTRELVALRLGAPYRTESIDWWRTCCEPGPIEDAGNAGLARISVLATDRDGRAHRIVFRVFVKQLVWWGDAAGERVREWRLYEVHRETDPCLFPSTAYGCR